MWNDDEVEYQLKLHTLQNIITSKSHQIKTIEATLDSISSMKIQSQDQILTLVAEVHKTMKIIERIVREIRQPCVQLSMGFLYQLVKNICCVLVGSIRLLSESFQSGVERNLVKFRSQKRKQLQPTICTRQKEIITKNKNGEESKTIQPPEKNSTDSQIQMEIDRLYQHILAEKQSVLRTSASNSFMKLNQVRLSWMNLMKDSDELLEEAFYRNIQELKEEVPERLHKPEYLSKILKQELSQRIKNIFKQYAGKAMKRIHHDFYSNQYKKIKQQILNNKPKTVDFEQQTDSDCLSKIKQVIKQKKLAKQLQDALKQVKRLTRQLQDVLNQKKQLTDEFNKINKINEINLTKIQQLQRKLAKYPVLKGLSRSSSRRSTAKHSRKSNFLNDFVQEDKVFDTDLNDKDHGQRYSLLERPGYSEIAAIIKKKTNRNKKINTKSRMHLEKLNSLVKNQSQINEKISGQNQQDLTNELQRKIDKDKNMQISLNQSQRQECMDTMAEMLSLMSKISTQQKERNSIKLENSLEQKKEGKQIQAMTDKALSNPELFSIFQNFLKRIVNDSFTKVQEPQQNDLNKSRIPKFSQIKPQQKRHTSKMAQKPIKQKRSTKQSPVLTNNLLVKFLTLENEKQNLIDQQKANAQNQKSEIQIYVENEVKLLKQSKNDTDKLTLEEKNKLEPNLNQQKIQNNNENVPQIIAELPKKISSSTQKKNIMNPPFNINGRFEKFQFNKPRHYLRQYKSNQKNTIQSFDLNTYFTNRPETKIQQRINKNNTINNETSSDKLICIQKMQPKTINYHQEIMNMIIQLCKNGKFDEVRCILSKNLGVSSRFMCQRQISRLSTNKLIKGVKYRMERLETS